VGLWIKENKNTDMPRILSRKAEPVFFAEGDYVFLPQESLERILKFADNLNIDYIILDRAFVSIYPMLKDLFISPPASIKLCYKYSDNNQEFLVFSP
jgi:hypothetical protein